jgi:hypothetical protein
VKDSRLGRLSQDLTALERATLVLRSWKDGREEDLSWRYTMPQSQGHEFNRPIELMNGVNVRLFPRQSHRSRMKPTFRCPASAFSRPADFYLEQHTSQAAHTKQPLCSEPGRVTLPDTTSSAGDGRASNPAAPHKARSGARDERGPF